MLRILRGLGSRSLECGCFVGVYETYAGATVEIVEERGPLCPERAHHEGRVVSLVVRGSHRRGRRARFREHEAHS